jgi:hypothetical protein
MVLHRNYKSSYLKDNKPPPSMQYIIAGTCIAICIGVIIFCFKIFKESKKMAHEKTFVEDEEETGSP